MGFLLIGITLRANTIIDLGRTTGQPADIPSELDRLNTQIKHYNDVYTPDLESAVGWFGTKTETPGGGKSITLDLEGFNGYILFKWGNNDQFYYINDLTVNNNTFPPMVVYNGDGSYTFSSDKLGLSHYTEFTPVPEVTTVASGALLLIPFFTIIMLRKFDGNCVDGLSTTSA